MFMVVQPDLVLSIGREGCSLLSRQRLQINSLPIDQRVGATERNENAENRRGVSVNR